MEDKTKQTKKKKKILRCPPYWEGEGSADNENGSLSAQTVNTDIYRGGVWPPQAVYLSPWKAKLKVKSF